MTRCEWNMHAKHVVEFSFAHGLAVYITWFAVYPLQEAAIGAALQDIVFYMPALLFLPTVAKALAAWMYGWWAIVYIAPTAVLQHMILDLSFEPRNLIMLFLYLSVAPAVRAILKFSGFDLSSTPNAPLWRRLVVVILLSSTLLSASVLWVYQIDVPFGEAAIFMSMFVLGDVAGTLLALFGLIVFFRFQDRRRSQVKA